MGKILNLTQHPALPAQLEAGVIDPPAEIKSEISKLLTFDEIPSRQEIGERATALVAIVVSLGYKVAMVGGAGYLMGPLEASLKAAGVSPVHTFTKRVITGEKIVNGKTEITREIKFAGFVEV
jgi:hypothetical protein